MLEAVILAEWMEAPPIADDCGHQAVEITTGYPYNTAAEKPSENSDDGHLRPRRVADPHDNAASSIAAHRTLQWE
jgi:hypothetical protein